MTSFFGNVGLPSASLCSIITQATSGFSVVSPPFVLEPLLAAPILGFSGATPLFGACLGRFRCLRARCCLRLRLDTSFVLISTASFAPLCGRLSPPEFFPRPIRCQWLHSAHGHMGQCRRYCGGDSSDTTGPGFGTGTQHRAR